MRRTVTFLGLAVMASGVWTLQRTYAVVGNCRLPTSGAATSGIDRVCSQTIFAYAGSFVLVSSGIAIMAIALTMRGRRSRLGEQSELRAIPRDMSTPQRSIESSPSVSHGQHAERRTAITR